MDDVMRGLRQRYDRYRWVRVVDGQSGAGVWRLDGRPSLYVKVARQPEHPDRGDDLGGETERLVWLRGRGFPVPEVVEQGTRNDVAWLVMTAMPGRPASAVWPRQQLPGMVDSLADLSRALHALPVDQCPFDRSLAVTVPHARHAAAAGLIDLDDLDEERLGWDTTRLLAELEASIPADENLVVCHGDLSLPNVLLDPRTLALTGLIDTGRVGKADRHADVALTTRSLSFNGLALTDRFLARYGMNADPDRLAFYRLLDEFF